MSQYRPPRTGFLAPLIIGCVALLILGTIVGFMLGSR